MKKLVFMIFLTASVLSLASSTIILSSLSSLYYTRNPIDNLFKTSWLELEAFYRPLGNGDSYQDVSVTLRLPFDYIAAAVTASYGGENLLEKFQNGEIGGSDVLSSLEACGNIAVQFASLILAVTIPPIRVNVSEQQYTLVDNNAKVAIGLGSVKFEADYRRYAPRVVKSGGAALYYINKDIVYLSDDGKVEINSDIDWMNAKVGLFADAIGYDGRVVLDLGFDLNGVKAMQEESESSESQGEVLLKYIYGTLEIEGKPLIMGVTYEGSGFLVSGGLNFFDMLKGWVEVVFDQEFNMQGFGVFTQLYF